MKFRVLDDGRPARSWPGRHAHLVGSDGNAIRSDISFSDGLVRCTNREPGTAAAVLQTDTGDCGKLILQTCLLPDREEPYLLNLELARHRLMILYNKLEDWGMFELGPDHSVTKHADVSRRLFVEALSCQGEDMARADKLAADSLVAALNASEALAMAHASLLLERRKNTGSLPKTPFGCGVSMDQAYERVRAGMIANFDFLQMPVRWRDLAPEEGEYRWESLDNWAHWLERHRIPVVAGPLVSFEPDAVPDWLFIWEHDYDNVRDLVYEYVEETVKRYRHVVSVWNVVSGLHVNDHFTFTFDQIMDLTRMTTLLVKELHPTAKVLVELRQPFGEYSSTNQRSIPPLTYADLLIQGGVNLDCFGLKLQMGQPVAGQQTRDLMQISNLLDQFAPLGKLLCVSIAAPSGSVKKASGSKTPSTSAADSNSNSDGANHTGESGHWRKPWSERIQSLWMESVIQIALSKPFVESVSWHALLDRTGNDSPLSGLVADDLQPKTAFRRLVALRRNLAAAEPDAVANAPSAAAPATD